MSYSVKPPNRDPLQDPLMFLAGGALIPLCKVALSNVFWGDLKISLVRTPRGVHEYFEYFETQCRQTLIKWEKYDLSELKFSHVAEIAKMLKAGITRPDIEQFLGETLVSDCRIIASEIIDLTVRLLLMVPIWSFWQGVRPDESALTWVEGTVERSFERHFRSKPKQNQSQTYEYRFKQHIILEKSLTAHRLEELGGMKVVWTDNLLDHLKLNVESNSIFIFHYASFLNYQRRNHIYPAGLIDETLKTLAIMLPRTDKDTRDWFMQQRITHHLDPEAVNCRSLTREEREIDNFVFWKQQLLSIKYAYDKVKPIESKSLLRRYFSAINLKQ
ncbi:hypothetical protein Golomagni_00264 [Golovinomyces magnicellulatus]|nr:hypothetical protein Golomagni_00264 [Golovinomyces magnicellulatus]